MQDTQPSASRTEPESPFSSYLAETAGDFRKAPYWLETTCPESQPLSSQPALNMLPFDFGGGIFPGENPLQWFTKVFSPLWKDGTAHYQSAAGTNRTELAVNSDIPYSGELEVDCAEVNQVAAPSTRPVESVQLSGLESVTTQPSVSLSSQPVAITTTRATAQQPPPYHSPAPYVAWPVAFGLTLGMVYLLKKGRRPKTPRITVEEPNLRQPL
ncbi:MAG: hypothetical protein KKD18_05945 [Nanoarchaeota archaeon]|nr:hypothetical protein [Nanoarchaeota archaeon]MBU0977933.1 hypothetical protein [Nanoarchaeota archaeon]